jgi:hypothetical protein
MSEKNEQVRDPKSAVILIALLVGLASFVAPVYAQLSSGSILGTVVDPTGAVIPGHIDDSKRGGKYSVGVSAVPGGLAQKLNIDLRSLLS